MTASYINGLYLWRKQYNETVHEVSSNDPYIKGLVAALSKIVVYTYRNGSSGSSTFILLSRNTDASTDICMYITEMGCTTCSCLLAWSDTCNSIDSINCNKRWGLRIQVPKRVLIQAKTLRELNTACKVTNYQQNMTLWHNQL